MRDMPWSLLLGVMVTAMVTLPSIAGRLTYDETYLTGGQALGDETATGYEEVSKRALIALSRFKPFASALSPDFHRYIAAPAVFDENFSAKAFAASRYAARSFRMGQDTPKEERRGRPPQNPMRFGR